MKEIPDVRSILEKSELLWNQGDREAALNELGTAYKLRPSHVGLAYEYGHMLGEMSSGVPSEQKARWRAEAIEVLARLCSNMQAASPDEQWKVRRHYYFYSGQHLLNRALGYEEMKRGNPLGILSVGFGCLHHAMELAEKKQWVEALPYALEAQEAFKKLLEIDAPKPGRLQAYALALAFSGREREAWEVTDQAARLLGMQVEELDEHNKQVRALLNRDI